MAERSRRKQRRSDSRDRGDRNRGGRGKNGEGGDHHLRRGGDNGGGGGGGASGAGVAGDVAEEETLAQQPGQLAAALTEGRGIEREDVQRRQPPSARLRPRARNTARWPWWQARRVKSHGRRGIWACGFYPPVASADDTLGRG